MTLQYKRIADGDMTRFQVSRDGRPVGGMTLESGIYRNGLVLAAIGVDRSERGGVGTKLYELALKEACSQGKSLISDSHRSPYSEAFWRKQTKKKRARCKTKGAAPALMSPITDLRKELSRDCRKQNRDEQWIERCTNARLKAMTSHLPVPKEGDVWPCLRWEIPVAACTSGSLESAPSRKIKPWMLWAAGGVALLAFAGNNYSFGGDSASKLDRDPKKLLPDFASKLELLFQRMRARGFDPVLWEGYRSPARAAALAKKGTGIADSLHSYGAAADIVDRKLLWDATPAFWSALGQEAQKLGLTWGGTFGDKPHVQAVSLQQQDAFRAMARAA